MTELNEKDFSLRLAKLRERMGVSARDMSLSIGQSENYINIIENGKSLPSLHGLVLICEYFGITLKEFFDVENKSPNTLNKLIEKVKPLGEEAMNSIITLIDEVKKSK